MSAPVPLSYAEKGDRTERDKDPTQNKITRDPGDARAEERQAHKQSKVARLGVHSCFRLERGSNQAAPPCVCELMALNRKTMFPRGRTAGHLSGSDRATRCSTGQRPRCGEIVS
jgi:hypothetical protein